MFVDVLRLGRFWMALLAAPAAMAPAVAAAGPVDAATLERLRGYDLRLATIGYRLTTANAALCRDLVPTPGMVVHALDQYGAAERPVARRVFGFDAPVAIEAVVAGGPAARAGVAAGDSLVAVGHAPIPPVAGSSAATERRDAALALIESQPPGGPLHLTLLRGGVRREVSVAAPPGCPTQFELLLGSGLDASADGHVVQVTIRFLERFADEQVAAIVAHELAHNVLRHRARLSAAGVKGGLGKEFGRGQRLTRVVEEQADRLSIHLLRNAGYDPGAAVRFWQGFGGGVGDLLFRSRTHPSSGARARAMAAEIARLPVGAPVPYSPPVLAERDVPLSNASSRDDSREK